MRRIDFFFNKFIYLFIYACVGSSLLHTRLSLVGGRWGATLHCGAWASHCSGFSCCGARVLGTWASVVVAHRLNSCGAQAYLFRGTWDLTRPGLKPVSPALAGRFLTTVPPGKSWLFSWCWKLFKSFCSCCSDSEVFKLFLCRSGIFLINISACWNFKLQIFSSHINFVPDYHTKLSFCSYQVQNCIIWK